MCGGEIQAAPEAGPLNRCPGSWRQGKGPRDLLGSLWALGREERERDSRTGVCLVFSEPPVAEATEEGLVNKEKEQECPHNPHTLRQRHFKLPRQSRVPAGPRGYQLGWTQRERGAGRCHKTPRTQKSCSPWERAVRILEPGGSGSEPSLSSPQSVGLTSWGHLSHRAVVTQVGMSLPGQRGDATILSLLPVASPMPTWGIPGGSPLSVLLSFSRKGSHPFILFLSLSDTHTHTYSIKAPGWGRAA